MRRRTACCSACRSRSCCSPSPSRRVPLEIAAPDRHEPPLAKLHSTCARWRRRARTCGPAGRASSRTRRRWPSSPGRTCRRRAAGVCCQSRLRRSRHRGRSRRRRGRGAVGQRPRHEVAVGVGRVDALAVDGRAPLQPPAVPPGPACVTQTPAPVSGSTAQYWPLFWPAPTSSIGLPVAVLGREQRRRLAEVVVRARRLGAVAPSPKNGMQSTVQASNGIARVAHLTAPVFMSSARIESK